MTVKANICCTDVVFCIDAGFAVHVHVGVDADIGEMLLVLVYNDSVDDMYDEIEDMCSLVLKLVCIWLSKMLLTLVF